jgi:hypothetical protein
MSNPAASGEEPSSPSRSSWVAPLALFLFAATLYVVTISHQLVSLDVWTANFASWHLVSAGNPWIEGLRIPMLSHNEFRDVWVLHAANGHTVIGRSPGVVAVTLPAYWLAHSSSMTTVPGGITAAVLTAGSLVLLMSALSRSMPKRDALLASLAFGFCTPVWSVAANGVWPHTVTILGLCGMAWAAATGRWWWMGVFGGVALWGRLTAALIVAIAGILVGVSRRDRRIVLRVGVVSGAALVLMCVWSREMYGAWSPAASYDSTTLTDHAAANRFSLVNQLGMWISPDRGILVWTPVILLLLPALVRSWRQLPDWSRALVWAGLAYTLLQASLGSFTGGDVFYGYRYGLEMLACLTPALAMSVHRLGRIASLLLGPLLAVQFVAIAFGAFDDNAYLAITEAWHRNAFLVAVHAGGFAGWLSVGIAALIGLLLQHMWRGASPSPVDQEPSAG